jgi:iron complex outermembrane receptor protein
VPLCTPQDLVTFGGRESGRTRRLWNYEVGAKSTLMGGRGTFNVAAFYMDIDDLQATVTAGSCSSRVIFNVPKARSTGVELEFGRRAERPLRLRDLGKLNNSELRSTLTSTDAAGNRQVVAGIESGNRLPTVPEFQIAGRGDLSVARDAGLAGYVTGTYQHIGSRFTQIGDQAAGFGTVNLNSFGAEHDRRPADGQSTFTFDPELPAYDIVNLRVGVLHRGNGGTSAFLVRQQPHRRAALLALDQERGTRARVGYLTNQPRTFGLTSCQRRTSDTLMVMLCAFLTSTPMGFDCDAGTAYPAGGLTVIV